VEQNALVTLFYRANRLYKTTIKRFTIANNVKLSAFKKWKGVYDKITNKPSLYAAVPLKRKQPLRRVIVHSPKVVELRIASIPLKRADIRKENNDDSDEATDDEECDDASGDDNSSKQSGFIASNDGCRPSPPTLLASLNTRTLNASFIERQMFGHQNCVIKDVKGQGRALFARRDIVENYNKPFALYSCNIKVSRKHHQEMETLTDFQKAYAFRDEKKGTKLNPCLSIDYYWIGLWVYLISSFRSLRLIRKRRAKNFFFFESTAVRSLHK